MIQLALVAVLAKKVGTKRLHAIGRTTVYTGAVLFLLGAVGLHKARAAVAEKGLQFGDDMAALGPLLQDVKTLDVNGQVVHVSTASTLEGTKAVLDRFEASCEKGQGGGAPVWNSIPETKDVVNSGTALTKIPIFRTQSGERGMIACLVPTTDAKTRDASIRRYLAGDTDTLSAGKLRYAHVSGGATGTSVITMWTDEAFDIGALMPDPDHDKPGSDPGVMLRPADAHRMLTSKAEGLPYQIYAYQTKQSPKEAIDSYDKEMIANGWVTIGLPQMAVVPHEGAEAHAYMRNGFIGYTTAATGVDGMTFIGVAETAKLPKPSQADKAGDNAF